MYFICAEVEPVDEKLKEEQSELLKDVDELVVDVAKRRKHAPHDMAVQLAKTCNHECSYLVRESERRDIPNPLHFTISG